MLESLNIKIEIMFFLFHTLNFILKPALLRLYDFG